QFADRLHFLSHRELLTRFYQLLVRIAPLCRVSKYIDKTDQISCIVAYRKDRACNEKRRAIFSDTPPFNFVLASLFSQFQRAAWCAGAAVIWPIKYPKILAYNFFRAVAHDRLSTAIPACNAPFFVKRKDRIVDDPFD